MNLKNFILSVADFPKAGVQFLDISPLLADPEAFEMCLEQMAKILPLDKVDLIAGIEVRGIIFAAALAAKYKKGFLPLRKAGKLPPPVMQASYSLEYGNAKIEIRPGVGKVVLIDDVLATGGTLSAAIELVARAGYDLQGVAVLANITALNSMIWNSKAVPSLLSY